MSKSFLFVVLLLAFPVTCPCADPAVLYKIHVEQTDLPGFDVEMHFSAHTRSVRLAMAAHPEYNDRYWRYIENFRAESGGHSLSFSKPEDPIWQLDGIADDVIVRYRLRLPKDDRSRDSWKPFLTPTGGMVGDLHSLMYIVGDTDRPARLTLDIPAGWEAVAGLEPTADPNTFAATTELMLDAPVMIGKFFSSDFVAGGVPHKIVIWSPPDAAAFDPKPLVDGIKKIAAEGISNFGKPPYRRYVFMFRNGGENALEHMTSVNFGHDFSGPIGGLFQTIAHEFVHAWNLMYVRPRERVGLQYRFAHPTGVLWWSEGATIMFADYLLRRTGLPSEPPTRIGRLETNISRYLSTPGYSTLSAEQASRGDSDPLSMGDNYASTHLQGELLSDMLDLEIRDVTSGKHSIVDVMRSLAKRFDHRHGISNADIENSAKAVCPRCAVHELFTRYIYHAGQIDFDRYLGLIGMRAEVARSPAVDNDGKPLPDTRLSPLPSETGFRIRITNPNSAWGRAGLHTGDYLLLADDKTVSSWADLRAWLRTLKIGDVAHLQIKRNGIGQTVDVPITAYETTTVHLVELSSPTRRQIRLRTAWSEAR